MKLWLDDECPAPDGWTWAKTYQEAIERLWNGAPITHLSLDHDLGTEETGYSVMLWIEQIAHDYGDGFPLPEITCHSANPVGRARIQQAIDGLKRRTAKKEST